jgi:hypothetical protein
MVQTLLGARVPLEKDRDPAPAENEPDPMGATRVGVPQPVVEVVVFAVVMEDGKVSVKFTPAIVSVVGLVNLIVMTEVPPGEIAFGVKVFEMVTEDGLTMFPKRAEVE